VTAPTNLSGNNPLSGAKLYVNPYNDTRRWFTERSNSDPANAALMKKIADQPESEWFGDWNRDIEGDARRTTDQITASGAVPVYVAYNIPQRDCGAYSAGGAGSGDAYKNWISGLANGIGNRKAVVLLEPDALPWLDCLSTKDQDTRVGLISDAVNILKSHPQIAVYLDAGHPSWKSADEMSSILLRAGISRADGFSLNISNFVSTGENISYGTKISEKTGGKHFVIDTGRNGNGSNGEWCNPWGRALGNKPNTSTGNNLVDAYLWVKGPGGSDGPCNGGPSAGVFWPDYALDIARNTSWW
jgi:endoglucanase